MPKPKPASRSSAAAASNPEPVQPARTKKLVVVVTKSVSEKEASTFKGLKNGLLGAPPENAADSLKLDEVVEVVSALTVNDIDMDAKPDLVVLDLESIVGDHASEATAANALKRRLKIRFMKSNVIATFVRLGPGPLRALGFKSLLDRKDTEFGEKIAKEGCVVLPSALDRYKRYAAV